MPNNAYDFSVEGSKVKTSWKFKLEFSWIISFSIFCMRFKPFKSKGVSLIMISSNNTTFCLKQISPAHNIWHIHTMQSEMPATCILADPETVVWMVLLAHRQKKATMAIIQSRQETRIWLEAPAAPSSGGSPRATCFRGIQTLSIFAFVFVFVSVCI